MIREENQNEHKIFHAVIALVLILFIVGNFKSINESLNGLKKIEKAEIDLTHEKKEVESLEKKLVYIQTDEYIEKEAFERFRYTKDGGTVLVMQNQNKDENHQEKQAISIEKTKSNFEKWIGYFKLDKL